MSNKVEQVTYTRTCKLNKIKECSINFTTNKKNKVFCCDQHRYQWHNNLKALFKRMSRVEEVIKDVKEAYSKLGEIITESIVSSDTFKETLGKIEKVMKERMNEK